MVVPVTSAKKVNIPFQYSNVYNTKLRREKMEIFPKLIKNVQNLIYTKSDIYGIISLNYFPQIKV